MKPLKTCIGGSAEGDNRFFNRDTIIKKIRRKLSNREHLLISAPRRIGKTSIIKHICATPEQHQIIKYLIVQSVNTIEDFNKLLFDELIKDQQIHNGVGGFFKRASTAVKRQISRVKGINFEGIELSDNETIDYYSELNKLFDVLKSHDKQIIIFIDEFPDAISNIAKTNAKSAIKLLQQQREIREKYKNSQIQFVYTGSTGLKNVVKKLGEIHLVNNLVEVTVPPFSHEEALELMQRLILGKQQEIATFTVPKEVILYALERIQWLLPYYIQIIVEELFDQYEEQESPVTNKSIDALFTSLVQSNSSHADYFEHWKSRLKGLEKTDRLLAMEVLSYISTQGKISIEKYHDLTVKHSISDNRHVLDILQYDGYLITDEDGRQYGFNSVLLKEWWKNNVAR